MSTAREHAIEEAMRQLCAAAMAQRLYFSEHRAVREGVVACERALQAALHAGGADAANGLELYHVGDRVLWSGGTLSASESLIDSVFGALVLRGFTSVRFTHGVSARELSAFVAALAAPTDEPLPLSQEHIRCGTAHSAPLISASAPRTPELLTEELRAALAAGQHAGVDTGQLESITGSICAAVGGAKGTVLEIAALKGHDEYTFVHTVNVALFAASLAETCGLSPSRTHAVTLSALLHDIGKRVIPLAILNKKAALDAGEREVMNTHPVEGARMLASMRSVPELAPVVAFEHHMHLDGTGYPPRPASWRPHLGSQIVQLADIFDALRTHRPYRAAMPLQQAAGVLMEGSGKRYDASLLDVFLSRVVARSSRDAGKRAA